MSARFSHPNFLQATLSQLRPRHVTQSPFSEATSLVRIVSFFGVGVRNILSAGNSAHVPTFTSHFEPKFAAASKETLGESPLAQSISSSSRTRSH